MTTTAGAGVLAASRPLASVRGPRSSCRAPSKPTIIASGNGHRFKNGGTKTCVETAWEKMMGGDDVLDSLIAGVNIVELDPEDTASDTAVCRMPTALCSSTRPACTDPGSAPAPWLRSRASRRRRVVAKMVLEHTDHHLIVGKDAQTFARNMGVEIFPDLNTPRSRAAWLEWKRADGSRRAGSRIPPAARRRAAR